jgi:hypothetical protein
MEQRFKVQSWHQCSSMVGNPVQWYILPTFVICIFSMLCFSGCAADTGSDNAESATSIETNATQRTILFCGIEEPDPQTLEILSGNFSVFTRTARALEVTREPFEIPVVFHILSESGDASDAILQEQINILNQAFSGSMGGVDTPFRFRLSEISRPNRPEWAKLGPGTEAETEAKKELRRGGAETLNVYIATIDGSNLGVEGSDVLGYASLPIFFTLIPFFDGIVMSPRALPGGSMERYNLGHVLVHEVGHWLGLFHTFQGECDGFFDDLVEDTPRERIPERGQFCPVGRNSCEHREGVDPIHNHMTYTEDGCRFEFTPGQVLFMRFNAIIFRSILV